MARVASKESQELSGHGHIWIRVLQGIIFVFIANLACQLYLLGLFGSQPIKLNVNKKLDPKQKTIQAFNIDA